MSDEARIDTTGDATRSEWEYPFAVGGVNVTYMLTELLELRKEPDVPRSAVFKCAPVLRCSAPLTRSIRSSPETGRYRIERSEHGHTERLG